MALLLQPLGRLYSNVPAACAGCPAAGTPGCPVQQQALHPVQHPLYGPLAPQYYFGAPTLPQQAPPPGFQQPASGVPSSWDQQSLASTFSTMTLQQPPQTDWYFDSGATSHMTSNSSTLSHILSPRYPFPSSIVVGDGCLLPITATGVASLPGHLSLNNVLVSSRLIKNLISVRRCTSDNNCSVEFDPSGCSVKDLTT